MRIVVVALAVGLAACGGRAGRTTTAAPTTPIAATVTDWMLAVLPGEPQIIVELDLARLRANAVVGQVAARLLADLGAEQKLPGLPMAVQGSPLAVADVVVLGAYGVGTPQAVTVVMLATKAEVAGAIRVAADIAVLGPEDWTSQVASRAAIAKLAPTDPVPLGGRLPVTLASELVQLRDHAMPTQAPGAVLRLTARLPFDARVALARQTGIEVAPAHLSIWADIVDDFAVIVDADAADPGEKNAKKARAQLARSLRGLLGAIVRDPAVRAIGVANNVAGARFVEQGTWVRIIIEVGPRQLRRAVERARAMLPPAS